MFVERIDYDDGFYAGLMDVWEQCGDAGSDFLVIAALPPEQDYITLVQIVVVGDRVWDAADQIIRTYNVFDPQVP